EEREREETYGEDDQRIFWDTVMKVLTSELGSTDDGHHEAADLSRVWDFVAHNREGRGPPAEASPSYRATGLYFPGLEAKPWWDKSEFPWLRALEEAAPDITREMKALARAGGQRSYRGGTGEMSTVYDATQGWGTMRIRYMGRFGQPGVNYALLPRTLSALRGLPLAPETAAFQRQLPGTGLPLHVDPSNFVLGCHLGVVIPSPPGCAGDHRTSRNQGGGGGGGGGFGFGADGATASTPKKKGGAATPKKSGGTSPRRNGDLVATGLGSGSGAEEIAQAAAGRGREDGGPDSSEGEGASSSGGNAAGTAHRSSCGDERAWIEVAGERRHWETGRAFVFDPSFLHCTRNPTEGERVILNVDVWHPGLRETEKTAICRVCELVEQWNTRSGVFEK
ncbi:unnamed protein product, partial [Hapterophycus canaliculatus]